MCHFGARVERPERRGVVSVAGGAWCGLRLLSVRGSTLLPSTDEVGRSEDVCSLMSGLSFVGDLGGERSGSLSTVTVGESVVRGQGLEMFGMGAGGMPVGLAMVLQLAYLATYRLLSELNCLTKT